MRSLILLAIFTLTRYSLPIMRELDGIEMAMALSGRHSMGDIPRPPGRPSTPSTASGLTRVATGTNERESPRKPLSAVIQSVNSVTPMVGMYGGARVSNLSPLSRMTRPDDPEPKNSLKRSSHNDLYKVNEDVVDASRSSVPLGRVESEHCLTEPLGKSPPKRVRRVSSVSSALHKIRRFGTEPDLTRFVGSDDTLVLNGYPRIDKTSHLLILPLDDAEMAAAGLLDEPYPSLDDDEVSVFYYSNMLERASNARVKVGIEDIYEHEQTLLSLGGDFDERKRAIKVKLADPAKKLLVFDLDETLIEAVPVDEYDGPVTDDLPSFKLDGTDTEYIVSKRPGMEDLLDWCRERFNLALWTSARQPYAEAILKIIDPHERYFPRHNRFYRQHNDALPGSLRQAYYKDVGRLSVDPRHVILVDNSPFSFYGSTQQVHSDVGMRVVAPNGIMVEDFRYDIDPMAYESENEDLKEVLADAAVSGDVRPVLARYWLSSNH